MNLDNINQLNNFIVLNTHDQVQNDYLLLQNTVYNVLLVMHLWLPSCLKDDHGLDVGKQQFLSMYINSASL